MCKMSKKIISNTNCCVYGCHSKKGKDPMYSFHTFPKKGTRQVRFEKNVGCKEKMDHQAAWQLVLKIDKPLKKHMKVCSRHFQKEDYFLFQHTGKHPTLKRNAIPSVNLPECSQSAKCIRLLPEEQSTEIDRITSITTNMEIKAEVSEENYEVKVEAEEDLTFNLEDLHSSIDIKQEPAFEFDGESEIGKPITIYMNNIVLLEQFEIKEEAEQEIEFNFEDLHHSVDNNEDPLLF